MKDERLIEPASVKVLWLKDPSPRVAELASWPLIEHVLDALLDVALLDPPTDAGADSHAVTLFVGRHGAPPLFVTKHPVLVAKCLALFERALRGDLPDHPDEDADECEEEPPP